MAAVVRAGQTSVGFWILSYTSVFNRRRFRADDFQILQHRQALPKKNKKFFEVVLSQQ